MKPTDSLCKGAEWTNPQRADPVGSPSHATHGYPLFLIRWGVASTADTAAGCNIVLWTGTKQSWARHSSMARHGALGDPHR